MDDYERQTLIDWLFGNKRAFLDMNKWTELLNLIWKIYNNKGTGVDSE